MGEQIYKCRECNAIFDNIAILANHYRWKHKKSKQYECSKCSRIFNGKSQLVNHEKSCNGNGIKKNNRGKKVWICPFCKQEIKASRQKHLNYCNGLGKRRLRPKMPAEKRLKGKTYEEFYGREKAATIKEKLSSSMIGNKNWSNMPEWKKVIFRERARKNVIYRYENGWEPKAGRAKKYKYKDFIVDGSWELEFCKWADAIGLEFERNKDRFNYIDQNGNERKYKPDFKINESLFVEIKGYETEKDRCKWHDFPNSLIVLKKSQINRIRKGRFRIDDLYEYIW